MITEDDRRNLTNLYNRLEAIRLQEGPRSKIHSAELAALRKMIDAAERNTP